MNPLFTPPVNRTPPWPLTPQPPTCPASCMLTSWCCCTASRAPAPTGSRWPDGCDSGVRGSGGSRPQSRMRLAAAPSEDGSRDVLLTRIAEKIGLEPVPVTDTPPNEIAGLNQED